jgi:hypothetical protein
MSRNATVIEKRQNNPANTIIGKVYPETDCIDNQQRVGYRRSTAGKAMKEQDTPKGRSGRE